MCCICFSQFICNRLHLCLICRNTHPCMCIFVVLLGKKLHILTGLNDRKIRISCRHIFHKRFDSASIDNKHIRRAQKLHIFRCQLKVMQTAGLWFTEIFESHICGISDNILGCNIHWIKRSNYRKLFGCGCFLPAGCHSSDKDRHQQNAGQHQTYK